MIRRAWYLVGWLGVAITVAISLGPPALDESRGHADKLAHLSGYAVLMFWWAQLVTRPRGKLAFALFLLGVVIELLQGLTPARQPDLLDVLANSGGILLGWLAAHLLPNLPQRLAALPAAHR